MGVETIRDARWVSAQVKTLADQLARDSKGELSEMVLAGIRTRGAILAERLRDAIGERTGEKPPLIYLDTTFYRDDYATAGPRLRSEGTDVPEPIDDRPVVLVDDVLHTGRTIRAALDLLMDFGRPSCVKLAVLVDRGGRQLPIEADYVGSTLSVPASARVRVHAAEVDGEDGVVIEENEDGRS